MGKIYIHGGTFIDALREAGLLPDRTVSVTIRATYGEPVRMEYECHPSQEELAALLPGIKKADSADDARAGA